MIQRFVRDESGMALGIAIFVMVIVGVMGAGLLVFVRNDLEAVVEVNQGQKALEAADAGVQAARRQLLSDATANATANIYDSNGANGDSPWSAVSGGRNLTFDTNAVNVRIQYLLPSDDPSELDDADRAPELTPLAADGVTRAPDYPEPVDYFKITAEATAGDARRKIEAIYQTYDNGVPKGYYTPGDIEVKGSACIDSVSLFTLGNITIPNNNAGGCTDASGNSIGPIKGRDNAYSFWNNPPFNTVARSVEDAGFGAVGSVKAVNGAPSPKAGTRDFDTNTCPKFVPDLNAPSSCVVPQKMTFPFNYALPDIDFLRDEALKQEAETGQNHYEEVNASTKDVDTWPTPPAGSDPARTVVFYKFTTPNGSNNLKWKVGNSCSNPPVEGTLVIEGGSFSTTQHTTPLKGAVIVRGGLSTEEGASTDTGGNTCLQGFINASGGITIAGSVKPTLPPDLAGKRPGFYGIELWSWRELYQ